jgi:acetyl-CoA C-acetyltransferase
MSNQPVIVAARRTAIGRFFGGYSRVKSTQLGSIAIQAVLNDAPAAKDHIDECVMGCVLQAGLGQNPARQAGLAAGLPTTLSAKTINKVCGSGLEAVMMAAQSIKAGDNDAVIAGGMENMTAAPHYSDVRAGVKFGAATMNDHMQNDGLTCAFEQWGMTMAADHIAKKFDISREEQDRYSAQSHQRAANATSSGWFNDEIIETTGEMLGNKRKPGAEGGVNTDEGIRGDSTPEGLAKLRSLPGHDTITAANASQISDGGAATIVMSESKAADLGLAPLCKVVSYNTSGVDPKDIFAAPIEGIRGALDKAGWTTDDVDLFEINEAFASQVLCNIKELGISEDNLNICGGGMALGHPIGASGARVLVTLIHQLKRTGGEKGVVALCLGGGNAVAMCIEMC